MATARQTVTKTTSYKRVNRGLTAVAGKKRGRPVGSKDSKPRKPRSDKGKKRGTYKKRSGNES